MARSLLILVEMGFSRSFPLGATVAVLALVAGCPMRPNPDWPGDGDPLDADADDGGSDVGEEVGPDGDLDSDLDAAQDADPESDADSSCPEGEVLCDGGCTSLSDPASCGGCDRVCSTEDGCSCMGADPRCVFHGGRRCYESCADDEVLCDGECIEQPSDTHCGACDVRCTVGGGCECRPSEVGEGYECLRYTGGRWVEC